LGKGLWLLNVKKIGFLVKKWRFCNENRGDIVERGIKMASTSSSSGGIGIFGATFIVLLVLKLIDKIDWSWWWITSPLWLLPALIIVVVIIYFVIVIILALTRPKRRCGKRWKWTAKR